ncbi:uncharacterized protein LOC128956049 [Oppia nitens]|uniref:uncharacterized protein LOC128956049 n=1 Tax=Oppia nitens TaxID=1686743 RepID=UPI0023DBF579|nr:uncharacterized protein LOC128956049 [Oppia nitens]
MALKIVIIAAVVMTVLVISGLVVLGVYFIWLTPDSSNKSTNSTTTAVINVNRALTVSTTRKRITEIPYGMTAPGDWYKKLPVPPDNMTKFSRSCLKAHNYYRSFHKVPNLTLSQFLIDYSWKRALELRAQGCNSLKHPNWHPNRPGDNIWFFCNSKILSPEFMANNVHCYSAVWAWYDELKYYNYKTENPFPQFKDKLINHFTQVVWLGSVELGCSVIQNYTTKCVTMICTYWPGGNINYEHYKNVFKPIQNASMFKID